MFLKQPTNVPQIESLWFIFVIICIFKNSKSRILFLQTEAELDIFPNN